MSFENVENVAQAKVCVFSVLGTETFYTDADNYLSDKGITGLEETLSMTLRYVPGTNQRVASYTRL